MAKKDDELFCKHNEHINCDETWKCDNCGWNPAVNKKRKDLLREVYDYDTGGDFDE